MFPRDEDRAGRPMTATEATKSHGRDGKTMLREYVTHVDMLAMEAEGRANELQRKADRMRALHNTLPEKLPPLVDDTLRELLAGTR
jgi:hypothetical protein